MVTGFETKAATMPGWVRADCEDDVTAGWLARAILMENVSARCEGSTLYLPAGPAYRLAKEIKNVVTVMAKTGHYWLDHTLDSKKREIGELFERMEAESPLIQPAALGHDLSLEADDALRKSLIEDLQKATGLQALRIECHGWLGLVCPTVEAAIWMMRAMVASNVCSRREETIVWVPVNPRMDRDGRAVKRIFSEVHGFARARAVL